MVGLFIISYCLNHSDFSKLCPWVPLNFLNPEHILTKICCNEMTLFHVYNLAPTDPTDWQFYESVWIL